MFSFALKRLIRQSSYALSACVLAACAVGFTYVFAWFAAASTQPMTPAASRYAFYAVGDANAAFYALHVEDIDALQALSSTGIGAFGVNRHRYRADLNGASQPARVESFAGPYFELLQVRLERGGFPRHGEPECVASKSFAESGKAGDADVLGAQLVLVDEADQRKRVVRCTITGVAQRDFVGLSARDMADIFISESAILSQRLVSADAAARERFIASFPMQGVLRLPGNVSADVAVGAVSRALSALSQKRGGAARRFTAYAAPGLPLSAFESLRATRSVVVPIAIAGFVLVIFALWYLEGTRSQQNSGYVRLAFIVGGRAVQVVRPLLAEAILIILVGAMLSAAVCLGVARFVATVPVFSDFPRLLQTPPEAVFAASGVFVGIALLLLLGRVMQVVRQSRAQEKRAHTKRIVRRGRSMFVYAAIVTTVVVFAQLVGLTLTRYLDIRYRDYGVAMDGLWLATVSGHAAVQGGRADAKGMEARWQSLCDGRPDCAVAVAQACPFSDTQYAINVRGMATDSAAVDAQVNYVSPSYLTTLGARLIKRDGNGAGVAISESLFSRLAGGDRATVLPSIRIGATAEQSASVLPSAVFRDIFVPSVGAKVRAILLPLSQVESSYCLILRDPALTGAGARRLVERHRNTATSLSEFETAWTRLWSVFTYDRTLALFGGVVAIAGTVLAVIALGLVAFARVRSDLKESAIRIALGCAPWRVVAHQGAVFAPGYLLGLALGIWIGALLGAPGSDQFAVFSLVPMRMALGAAGAALVALVVGVALWVAPRKLVPVRLLSQRVE